MFSLHYPLTCTITTTLTPFFSTTTTCSNAHKLPTSNRYYSCIRQGLLLLSDKPKSAASGVEPIRAANAEAEAEMEPPTGLWRESMPRHVAVIMDGNVRWAKKRGLPSSAGHVAGSKALIKLVALCNKYGIKVLSVFAFSMDNWSRSNVEVDFLMSLFERVIKSDLDNFIRQGIRISVIGDTSKLPKSLQKLIADAEETTKDFTNLQLIIALSYSGKYDILKACRNIAQKAKDGAVEVGEIDEGLIEQELETNCTDYPYPDFLIRTSGELRVSNFLLWQLAYTELFFARAYWPDFGEEEFVEALRSYQQRSRRYGGRNFNE